MIIKKKRIRSVKRYVPHQLKGERVRVIVPVNAVETAVLSKVGFTDKLVSGETVLPSPAFGPLSRFNALGKVKVRKDMPMETVYRMQEWHWRQWKGPYDFEDCSKIVDVPYQRYPREEIAPPSIELQLSRTRDAEICVQSPSIAYTEEQEELRV